MAQNDANISFRHRKATTGSSELSKALTDTFLNNQSVLDPELLSLSPVVHIYNVFETIDGFTIELELCKSMDLYDLMCLSSNINGNPRSYSQSRFSPEPSQLPSSLIANQLMTIGCSSEYDQNPLNPMEIKSQTCFNEKQVIHIIRQLVSAVSCCYKSGIAHRDIKPSNITLAITTVNKYRHQHPLNRLNTVKEGSNDIEVNQGNLLLRIKLADFGMSGFVSKSTMKLHGRCGTPGHL